MSRQIIRIMEVRNNKVVLILGGQRSGKSEAGEEMALSLSDSPIYVATCVPADAETDERIERHRLRRAGHGWQLIESTFLSGIKLQSEGVALIDSGTMLASNAFFACGEDVDKALAAVCSDFDAFLSGNPDETIIIVSDEVGLGGVSPNAMARAFSDLQGLFNRHMASRADEVYMTVAGITVKIKPQ